MREKCCHATLFSGAFMVALSLALAAGASLSARAQERAAEFAPREEMIDAIMHYADSGGCEALNRVFGSEGLNRLSGSTVSDVCKAGSDAETMARTVLMLSLLSAKDAPLIDICTRTKLSDCEKGQEVSTGAPVLAFHASVGTKGASHTAAWSPDNRFLLVFANPELAPRDFSTYTLIIDLEQQQSRVLISDPVATMAVAWSPDGKYIAVNRQRAIHLYASDTLEEKGRIEPRGTQCGIYRASKMAFAADSSALWVACPDRASNVGPLAIKLGVPALQIEDRLLLGALSPGWSARFRTSAISRRGDDLVLIGVAHGWGQDKWELTARSFSLATKEPLHPPVSYLHPEQGESDPDVFLTDDLSGILFRFSVVRPDGAELWSTRSGEPIARLNPKTMMDGRALGAPNRIPSSPLHIEEEPLPSSVRRALVVLDSRSGATVQEIGPVTSRRTGAPEAAGCPLCPSRSILVSPDGKMVAHFGRHEIRFYRVNAEAAAPPPAQRQ